MDNIHEDITTLNTEVEDLEEDTESQITIIQADISIINSEQILQDAQIIEIQNSVETVEADVAKIGELEASLSEVNQSLGELSDDLQDSVTTLQETDAGLSEELSSLSDSLTVVMEDVDRLTVVPDDLVVSVVSLQETDNGIMEDISQLTEFDNDLDSRLSELEIQGTVGFHAVLGDYTSIPLGSVVVFPIVNVNLGNGYNGETGEFFTPVGGAGLYFFYAHFQVQQGERAQMDIRVNGSRICQMAENDGSANGYPGSSCGAAVVLEEGKNGEY